LSKQAATSCRTTGTHWERVAESFLTAQGLSLLERNFSSRFGEIDLIMEEGNTLVFILVRYRQNSRHGSGADSVTYHKQRKLSMTAGWYLAKNPQQATQYCRFDVISIGAHGQERQVDWIKNAFYSTIG